MEIVCEPMLEYGAREPAWEALGGGPPGLSILDAADGDSEAKVRLFSDIRMGIEGNRTHGRHTMVEGEKRYCALSWTEARGGPETVETGRAAASTPRPSSGAPGWRKATTPNTPGGATCSARRWP